MTPPRILKSQRSTAPAPKLSSCPMSPTAAPAPSVLRPNHPSLLPDRQTTKQQHHLSAEGKGAGKENKHFNASPEKPFAAAKCRDEEITNDADQSMEDSSSNSSSTIDSLALSSSSSEASPTNERSRERGVLSLISSGGAKRLQYTNEREEDSEPRGEYDAYSNNDDDDDQDEDDDCSECSGETVVANDFPPVPENATQEEMNLYYWEVCYGDQARVMMARAKKSDGVRSAPAKSCLSTKKMKRSIGAASSMTPRRLHPSPPSSIASNDDSNLSTPNDEDAQLNTTSKTKTHSAVKFGNNSAAEFDKLQPITEMTPMPSDVVQEIFPSESKEETVEEQQISRETAQNVAMLAEWDDLFDEEDDLDQTPQRKRGKKRTPYRSRNRRPQKSRRDSELFSRERRSLLEDSDGEDDSHSGLPLCVAIDPEQYTSPSSVAPSELTGSDETTGIMSKRDSISTTEARVNRYSLDSTNSACISPSSIRSGRSLGRETPKSARTSSSTILRAVHASGAEVPADSPRESGGLRPNQLNYSPGSMARSNSSPMSYEDSSAATSETSDNHSLGSDIMSLFTQHTIESESDADLFQRQLSILSHHPLQMLQLQVGDMAQMMNAMQKDPLKFLNENVLRSLTPATALSLVQDGGSQGSLFSANRNNTQSFGCVESILLNEIMAATNNRSLGSFGKSSMATTVDHTETISSCVKTCHDTATYEWSNHELAIAECFLDKFQAVANKTENERDHRHPKSKSTIQEEADRIKALEEELAVESNRLKHFKRAQRLLHSSLEIEQSSGPIGALSEDVRTRISPTFEPLTDPFTGSDFTFSLLDGSAEVSTKIDLDNQEVEAGLSVKHGGSAIKLLRAIFSGNMDSGIDEAMGLLPIRNSILSPIVQTQDLYDTSCLFLRVDSLCKSVRSLESEYLCSIDSECGNIHLSFSDYQNGEVIKVDFEFELLLTETWDGSTVPNDVKVVIVSPEDDRDQISNLLQQKARGMLSSASHVDPSLLHRIVNSVILGLLDANAE